MTRLADWANALAFWLCFFPGPLLPYLLVWLCSQRKVRVQKILAVGSVIAVIFFAALLVVPYYACRFYDPNVTPYQAGRNCWILKVPIIEAYAYVYSYYETGFCWLILATLAAAFGEFSERAWVDRVLRGGTIIVAGFLLTLVRALDHTINSFLE